MDVTDPRYCSVRIYENIPKNVKLSLKFFKFFLISIFRKQNKEKDFKGSPLFGEWQVDHYEPPIASNEKVPRNDFGNVDLYQECMLPIGTPWIRHLDLDMGVFSRVCRKQQIDAAKAVVGFDGKKGYPVTEGYVICKEFEVRLNLTVVV